MNNRDRIRNSLKMGIKTNTQVKQAQKAIELSEEELAEYRAM